MDWLFQNNAIELLAAIAFLLALILAKLSQICRAINLVIYDSEGYLKSQFRN